MGRPCQSPVLITHFSHPHPLRLTVAAYPPSAPYPPSPTYPPTTSNPPSAATAAQCAGCALPASSSIFYSCSPCGFFLHFTCANLRPLLIHPCDPAHGLALLPSPPYSDGRYTCDACARPGSGFVYHCAVCVLDFHTLCARAASAVSCSAHPQHALTLTFTSPYGVGKGFTCDVCGRGGAPREWLYRCATCEFDVHLVCDGEVAEAPDVQVNYGGDYKEEGMAGGGSEIGGGGFGENLVQEIVTGIAQGIIGGRGGEEGGGSSGFAAETSADNV